MPTRRLILPADEAQAIGREVLAQRGAQPQQAAAAAGGASMTWDALMALRPWELDETLFHTCQPPGVLQVADRTCWRLNLVLSGRSWSPTDRWEDCAPLAWRYQIGCEPPAGDDERWFFWALRHSNTPPPVVATTEAEARLAICRLALYVALRQRAATPTGGV